MGRAEDRLLDTLLERCQAQGLLRSRGQQRTDSTHVLAPIRVLNRLERVGETLRAALNELAGEAPEWLQSIAPLEWYERYSQRIEDTRLPRDQSKRDAYAQTVGEDGFALLDALDDDHAPEELRDLPIIDTLRRIWHRHYERSEDEARGDGRVPKGRIRFKDSRELPRAAEAIESPYDVEARFRTKRDTTWTGYMGHVSETCEEETPHLLTHVHTTVASVHEAKCTDEIDQALVNKAIPPRDHFVDAAYISAELLVKSQQDYAMALRGPTRSDPSWQAQEEGAYSLDQFAIDWDHQYVRCPQGKESQSWVERVRPDGHPFIQVRFSSRDCGVCESRALCTRTKPPHARLLKFHPRIQYEALQAAQACMRVLEGQRQYARRAGVEGTLSQGVRAFGMRRTRCRGLDKTHLQNVAIAAAINVDRLVAWFDGRPRATTRMSRFAMLSPPQAMGPG